MPAELDETIPAGADPEKITRDLAVQKVQKVITTMKGRLPYWICGADTVVTLNGEFYCKPESREDAKQMLTRLSGKKHEVITSMALYNGHENIIDSRSAKCSVSFAPISQAEIEWYLNTSEWQGVAGGYRIQGLASLFISEITGSPSAAVGLPLRDFYVMLRENGYPYGG
jgi:septum formation protein